MSTRFWNQFRVETKIEQNTVCQEILITLRNLRVCALKRTITCQKYTDPYKMTGSLFKRIGKKSNKYI